MKGNIDSGKTKNLQKEYKKKEKEKVRLENIDLSKLEKLEEIVTPASIGSLKCCS